MTRKEFHSTARLFAVILCVWNTKLRKDLIEGQAAGEDGSVKSAEWSRLGSLTSALEKDDLLKIQKRFQKDGKETDAKFERIKKLFPDEGGFRIWVAGEDCPSPEVVNAMFSAVRRLLPDDH